MLWRDLRQWIGVSWCCVVAAAIGCLLVVGVVGRVSTNVISRGGVVHIGRSLVLLLLLLVVAFVCAHALGLILEPLELVVEALFAIL